MTRSQTMVCDSAVQDDLGEALEDWRHELDLAGPFAPSSVLIDLLKRVPVPASQDASFLAGHLAGRALIGGENVKGPPEPISNASYWEGVIVGMQLAIGQRFGVW